MAHGMYHYVQQAWKKPDMEILRKRMIDRRESEAITEVEKPLRLDRARALGYKAKKGFFVARVRMKRGGHKRPRARKARKGANLTIRKNLKMSYQWIAEQKVQRSYKNLEVLNSYWVGKDGLHYWF